MPVLLEDLERQIGDAQNEDELHVQGGHWLALVEVLENAHLRLLVKWESVLLLSIYRGACDKLLRVRNAEGKAINVGVRAFGRRASTRSCPS